MISLKEPIWSKKAVGIAKHKMVNYGEYVEVEILYTKKDGSRWMDGVYEVAKAEIIKHPIMKVKGNVQVYIVPISSLRLKSGNNTPKTVESGPTGLKTASVEVWEQVKRQNNVPVYTVMVTNKKTYMEEPLLTVPEKELMKSESKYDRALDNARMWLDKIKTMVED